MNRWEEKLGRLGIEAKGRISEYGEASMCSPDPGPGVEKGSPRGDLVSIRV